MATAMTQRNAASHPQSSNSPAMNSSNAPQGTFLPGTKVQVGSHRVIIEKYLSEGGFAHVYVVRIPREGSQYDLGVLKRVAVPDKEHLGSMRTEVETMKKLKGHKHIVTYFDSHASQLKGGGYEVFLLMEFCQGGGLIDFMNTRLQHRLIEVEILKIFEDVAQGVACMHYLKPPLLHRDLKVENVLISKGSKDGIPLYKLCDFGSTASPRPAATTAAEGRLIEEDVQKHTTMQYRSPEMIDVWRKQPIDEKADIWALGVLLYKLCYYTTPFEEVGQMAILNASFKYPAYPQFSDRLKKLIGWMLKEDPKGRPNIYQVIKEVCSMRGSEVPVKDIYTYRTQSEQRRNESLPSRIDNKSSQAAIGLQKTTATVERQALPDITPMRRGRPGATQSNAPSAKPQPSPARGDPFAALDSKNFEVRAGAVDELSKRFPSLDEFSITHEKSGSFQFNQTATTNQQSAAPRIDLQEKVTNALADEAFSSVKTKNEPPTKPAALNTKPISVQQATGDRSAAASYNRYTSTGVGSSPPLLPKPPRPSAPEAKPPTRSIWRVPSHHKRSESQPRASPESQAVAASLQPSLPPTHRPALLDMHRSKSQTSTVAAYTDRTPSPSAATEDYLSLSRAKTTQARSRPNSAYVASNLDFLRDQESARKPSIEIKRGLNQSHRQHSPHLIATDDGDFAVVDDVQIENDMDFLHSREDDQTEAKHKHHRKSSSGMGFSGHRKRNSLPSISGATKEIFKGRFGDAFKRFEAGKDDALKTPPNLQIHTPERELGQQENKLLSPIAGSDATPSKASDDDGGSALDESQELPADVKREMERRRLSEEERRVAEAARQYRERMASGNSGVQAAEQSRGAAIQQRVKTLLDDGSRSSSPVKRTAEGYGRYTDTAEPDAEHALPPRSSSLIKNASPAVAQKPVFAAPDNAATVVNPRQRPQQMSATAVPPTNVVEAQRTASRPSAPPKPKVLRTSQWPPAAGQEVVRDKPLPPQPSGNLAALLAKDLEGVPDYPTQQNAASSANRSAMSTEDIEREFSRRYPSLSGIEMVETDVGGNHASAGRVREV